MSLGESDDIQGRLQAGLLNLEKGQSDGLVGLIKEIDAFIRPAGNSGSIFEELSSLKQELTYLSDSTPNHAFLSQLFFKNWKFKLANLDSELSESDMLLSEVVKNRYGHPLVCSIIYQNLAHTLGLQSEIINLNVPSVVKTCIEDKVVFLDLCNDGEPLCEEAFLEKVNHCNGKGEHDQLSPLAILENISLVTLYLRKLGHFYRATLNKDALIKTLTARLILEPANTKKLAERAMLWKDLGEPEKALHDLKRYFAFSDKAHAPTEIKMAFYELQAFQTASRPDLLH